MTELQRAAGIHLHLNDLQDLMQILIGQQPGWAQSHANFTALGHQPAQLGGQYPQPVIGG
jgi:hypothetical protein